MYQITAARALILTLTLSACSAGSADAPVAPTGDAQLARSSAAVANTLSSEVLAGLAQIRRVTARYHDIDKAMEDGYTVWSPDPFAAGATCPSSPQGNMGYHLVNVALRGGASNPAAGEAVIDLLHPEMLLYEKRPDGQLHLVGVEYIVFQAAWERQHGVGAAPPTVLGQPLLWSSHTFVAGGPSIPHYELHVWVWSNNPLGMFSPWNPAVTC